MLALAAGLALACGSASAAVYRGSFDPQYTLDINSNLYNLGFRGEATFQIDNSCLDASGWIAESTCGTSNPDISILSAWVDLYVFNSTDQSTVQHLDFVPDGSNLPVLGAYIDPTTHNLAGIDTSLIGPQTVDATQLADIFQGPIWLQFVSGFMPGGNGIDPAYLYTGNCTTTDPDDANGNPGGGDDLNPAGDPDSQTTCSPDGTPSQGAVITFTRLDTVPEPGSVPLIAAALGGLWWLRRKPQIRRI